MGLVLLRRATPHDIDLLVPMINTAYARTESHVFLGTPRTERHDMSTMVSGITVAEAGGRIVGCVHVDATGDPAHFGLLAIDTSLQRGGIGSLLVEHAESLARDSGAATMRIETVKQAGLMPFYERQGYRIIGETDGQLWNGGADWGAVDPWQMVDLEKDLR